MKAVWGSRDMCEASWLSGDQMIIINNITVTQHLHCNFVLAEKAHIPPCFTFSLPKMHKEVLHNVS